MWKIYRLEVYMHPKLCMYEHFDLITNPFKCKSETSQIFKHPFQKIVVSGKWNSWVVDLKTFKMIDSTHVQILIIQKMQKNSLTHSSINVKHEVVLCVSIYTSKCNMQHLNSGFNKLKVDYSTHLKMLIVQKMWEFSLNYSNIIIKKLITCVLVYYIKWKIQFE